LKGDDFLTKSISGFSRVLESVVTTEDISRAPGLLQSLDPRVKLVSFLLFIVGVSLVHSLPVLGGIFVSDNTFEFNIKNISRFLPETGPDFCPNFYISDCDSGPLSDSRTSRWYTSSAKLLLPGKGRFQPVSYYSG
jgi:hypothetical protein